MEKKEKGRKAGGLICFDPHWENVRREDGPCIGNIHPYIYTYCNGNIVNLRIRENHLLKNTGGKFKMGKIRWRFMTVMEKIRSGNE